MKITFDPPAAEEAVPMEPLRDERRGRRMQITAAMIRKYGYTEGCEACLWQQRGVQQTKGHSEVCRTRVMKEMESDDEGRKKLKKEKERLDRYVAEEIEKKRQEEGRDS